MRMDMILLVLMKLATNQLKAQHIMDLDKKQDVYFKSDTEVPFTGEAYSFFEDGKIQTRYQLVNGRLEGPQQHLNEKGRLVKEVYFRNGLQDGKYREYYPGGKRIKQEGLFKKDLPYGKWVLYNNRGEIIKEEVYDELGERISMRTFR